MLPTIIGVSVLTILVGAVIAKMIIDKKNGKGGCSCGCSSCANRENCHPNKNKSK